MSEEDEDFTSCSSSLNSEYFSPDSNASDSLYTQNARDCDRTIKTISTSAREVYGTVNKIIVDEHAVLDDCQDRGSANVRSTRDDLKCSTTDSTCARGKPVQSSLPLERSYQPLKGSEDGETVRVDGPVCQESLKLNYTLSLLTKGLLEFDTLEDLTHDIENSSVQRKMYCPSHLFEARYHPYKIAFLNHKLGYPKFSSKLITKRNVVLEDCPECEDNIDKCEFEINFAEPDGIIDLISHSNCYIKCLLDVTCCYRQGNTEPLSSATIANDELTEENRMRMKWQVTLLQAGIEPEIKRASVSLDGIKGSGQDLSSSGSAINVLAVVGCFKLETSANEFIHIPIVSEFDECVFYAKNINIGTFTTDGNWSVNFGKMNDLQRSASDASHFSNSTTKSRRPSRQCVFNLMKNEKETVRKLVPYFIEKSKTEISNVPLRSKKSSTLGKNADPKRLSGECDVTIYRGSSLLASPMTSSRSVNDGRMSSTIKLCDTALSSSSNINPCSTSTETSQCPSFQKSNLSTSAINCETLTVTAGNQPIYVSDNSDSRENNCLITDNLNAVVKPAEQHIAIENQNSKYLRNKEEFKVSTLPIVESVRIESENIDKTYIEKDNTACFTANTSNRETTFEIKQFDRNDKLTQQNALNISQLKNERGKEELCPIVDFENALSKSGEFPSSKPVSQNPLTDSQILTDVKNLIEISNAVGDENYDAIFDHINPSNISKITKPNLNLKIIDFVGNEAVTTCDGDKSRNHSNSITGSISGSYSPECDESIDICKKVNENFVQNNENANTLSEIDKETERIAHSSEKEKKLNTELKLDELASCEKGVAFILDNNNYKLSKEISIPEKNEANNCLTVNIDFNYNKNPHTQTEEVKIVPEQENSTCKPQYQNFAPSENTNETAASDLKLLSSQLDEMKETSLKTNIDHECSNDVSKEGKKPGKTFFRNNNTLESFIDEAKFQEPRQSKHKAVNFPIDIVKRKESQIMDRSHSPENESTSNHGKCSSSFIPIIYKKINNQFDTLLLRKNGQVYVKNKKEANFGEIFPKMLTTISANKKVVDNDRLSNSTCYNVNMKENPNVTISNHVIMPNVIDHDSSKVPLDIILMSKESEDHTTDYTKPNIQSSEHEMDLVNTDKEETKYESSIDIKDERSSNLSGIEPVIVLHCNDEETYDTKHANNKDDKNLPSQPISFDDQGQELALLENIVSLGNALKQNIEFKHSDNVQNLVLEDSERDYDQTFHDTIYDDYSTSSHMLEKIEAIVYDFYDSDKSTSENFEETLINNSRIGKDSLSDKIILSVDPVLNDQLNSCLLHELKTTDRSSTNCNHQTNSTIDGTTPFGVSTTSTYDIVSEPFIDTLPIHDEKNDQSATTSITNEPNFIPVASSPLTLELIPSFINTVLVDLDFVDDDMSMESDSNLPSAQCFISEFGRTTCDVTPKAETQITELQVNFETSKDDPKIEDSLKWPTYIADKIILNIFDFSSLTWQNDFRLKNLPIIPINCLSEFSEEVLVRCENIISPSSTPILNSPVYSKILQEATVPFIDDEVQDKDVVQSPTGTKNEIGSQKSFISESIFVSDFNDKDFWPESSPYIVHEPIEQLCEIKDIDQSLTETRNDVCSQKSFASGSLSVSDFNDRDSWPKSSSYVVHEPIEQLGEMKEPSFNDMDELIEGVSDEAFDSMDEDMKRLEEKIRQFECDLEEDLEMALHEENRSATHANWQFMSSPLPMYFPPVCLKKTKHFSLMNKLDFEEYEDSNFTSEVFSSLSSGLSDNILFPKRKRKLKPGDRRCVSDILRRKKVFENLRANCFKKFIHSDKSKYNSLTQPNTNKFDSQKACVEVQDIDHFRMVGTYWKEDDMAFVDSEDLINFYSNNIPTGVCFIFEDDSDDEPCVNYDIFNDEELEQTPLCDSNLDIPIVEETLGTTNLQESYPSDYTAVNFEQILINPPSILPEKIPADDLISFGMNNMTTSEEKPTVMGLYNFASGLVHQNCQPVNDFETDCPNKQFEESLILRSCNNRDSLSAPEPPKRLSSIDVVATYTLDENLVPKTHEDISRPAPCVHNIKIQPFYPVKKEMD